MTNLSDFALLELGGFGVLAIAFLLVLRWMMTRFDYTIKSNTCAILTLSASMMATQHILLAHDLTVTGINPSTGADLDARAQRAYTKYCDLEHKIDETRRIVEGAIKTLDGNPA